MRLAMAFDPIEAGEVDNFAFDFTADVGAATIASTNWTCALAPYQTATDPTPQARILSASAQTLIQVRSPLDGSLQHNRVLLSRLGRRDAGLGNWRHLYPGGHHRTYRRPIVETQFHGSVCGLRPRTVTRQAGKFRTADHRQLLLFVHEPNYRSEIGS